MHTRIAQAQAAQAPRASEAALAEREALYRLLAENIANIVALYDQTGRCVYVSPSVQAVLGHDVDMLLGTRIDPLVHQEDLAHVHSVRARPVLRDRPRPDADGAWRVLDVDIADVTWQGTPHLLVAARDVTARKALEGQLLQVQKLEGVGRLAGGIAHDYNNILAAILGYAELAAAGLPRASEARSDLAEIRTAAQRAAALTRQLLAFARKQVMTPTVLPLNDLIFDLDGMLRRLIGEDIELVVLPGDGQPHVRVDAGQIEQVLINLAVNARDATPNGGRITIKTEGYGMKDEAPPSSHILHLSAPPPAVLLLVSDTGTGMAPEVLAQAFDPFFTTKPVGEGTGLGLATCYGIIEQHGGLIQIDSHLGEGTTVRIVLPATADPLDVMPQEDGGAVDGAQVPPPGTTVLVVEDEPAVRAMAARVLREQGYTVLEADNGADALEVLAAHHGPIDLLLADVVMPQMRGKTLAEHLLPHRPDLKVLFMSRYPGRTIAGQGRSRASPAISRSHLRRRRCYLMCAQRCGKK